MPFLELSLIVRTEQQPGAEEALDDLGALSITLQDANAETPDEQAIFEPGVGELPLWPTITLHALFDEHADRRGLSAALGELLPWLEPDQLSFAEIADQDWERAWMDQFKPMPFGRRLWIYPWNIEPPVDDDLVIVRLDPGLAFGSGTHPTTALCLEWLDGLELAGKTITDYGCGSGILAIAAARFGAAFPPSRPCSPAGRARRSAAGRCRASGATPHTPPPEVDRLPVSARRRSFVAHRRVSSDVR